MRRKAPLDLSRRERQILEVLYRSGRATAAEVASELPDAPTLTTVRGLLRILEQKGHAQHDDDGVRYIYFPVTPKNSAGTSMLAHVVRTFFNGSPSAAMAALLGNSSALDGEELKQLRDLVEKARKDAK